MNDVLFGSGVVPVVWVAAVLFVIIIVTKVVRVLRKVPAALLQLLLIPSYPIISHYVAMYTTIPSKTIEASLGILSAFQFLVLLAWFIKESDG